MVVQPDSLISIDALDSLVVSCTATGAQVDEFIFTRDDQILVDDVNTRIIVIEETAGGLTVVTAILGMCATAYDVSGEYSCIASNSFSIDFATFSVEVSANGNCNYYQ